MAKRRTEIEILQCNLKQRSPQCATLKELVADISLGWSAEKIARVIDRAVVTEGSAIHRGRGGNVEFTGTERGNSRLYEHAMYMLRTHWAKKRNLKGDIIVYRTARGGKRSGNDWMHPDLVLQGRPPRRRSVTDEPDFHSFEVERPGAFKIESIFQAYVQGRGADFSWVICYAPDLAGSRLDRALWAANSVGVGLITYVVPSRWQTWNPTHEAQRRQRNTTERAAFELHAFGIGGPPGAGQSV